MSKLDGLRRVIRNSIARLPGGVPLEELRKGAQQMGLDEALVALLDEMSRAQELVQSASGSHLHPGPRFLQIDGLLEELARQRAVLASATGTEQMIAAAAVQASAACVQAVALAELVRLARVGRTDFGEPCDDLWHSFGGDPQRERECPGCGEVDDG